MKTNLPSVAHLFTREQILRLDYSDFLSKYNPELLSGEQLKRLYGTMVIGVENNNDTPGNLFETAETRRFIQSLHHDWPFCFFFLNTSTDDLKHYVFCLPALVATRRESGGVKTNVKYNPGEMLKIVHDGLLALEKAADRAGIGPLEVKTRSREILAYFKFIKT